MATLTQEQQSKVKFYYAIASPLSLDSIYFGDVLTKDYDTNELSNITSSLTACDSAYTELNTPTLQSVSDEDVTQNIETVSTLTSATTTYGDRNKLTKKLMTYNKRLGVLHGAIDRLSRILGVSLY